MDDFVAAFVAITQQDKCSSLALVCILKSYCNNEQSKNILDVVQISEYLV